MCSPRLLIIDWAAYETTRDSDHVPVFLNIAGNERGVAKIGWNIKRADWRSYIEAEEWKCMPEVEGSTCEELVNDLFERIRRIFDKTIPRYLYNKFFPKPWWKTELTQSLKEMERAYKAYRNTRSVLNLVRWKRIRAKHRQLVRTHKKASWREMTSKVNIYTKLSVVWQMVRRVQGGAPKRINILTENGISYTSSISICNKIAEAFAKVPRSESCS